MMELLGQILGFIWDMLPRPGIVGPTEEACRYWFGRKELSSRKKSGIYFIWPLVMEWRVYQVVSQICETAIVPVADMSGQSWQFRLAIEFEVADVLVFNEAQYDGQVHLEQLGSAALVTSVSRMSTADIVAYGIASICEQIAEELHSKVERRGIRVVDVRAIMADRCMSLFHSQSQKLSD